MPHPSGRPWVVAHRGASRARPENTIAAFVHAAELGADGVELDVRRTADGALVVHHDPGVAGIPIIELDRLRLRELAPDVPDLDQAIEACAGMWVDVEVKNFPHEPDWDPAATVAMEMASSIAARPDVLISSFDPASVRAAVAAGARAGLLIRSSVDPMAALATVPGIEMLLPPISSMHGGRAAAVVAAAAGAGVEVGSWWTDDPDEMLRLAAAGVGVVFTNRPDVARVVLG